jgi:hypothetical protein
MMYWQRTFKILLFPTIFSPPYLSVQESIRLRRKIRNGKSALRNWLKRLGRRKSGIQYRYVLLPEKREERREY